MLKEKGKQSMVLPLTASESQIAVQSTQFRYNTDYFVGDYVTVEHRRFGLRQNKIQLIGMIESFDRNGRNLTPTFRRYEHGIFIRIFQFKNLDRTYTAENFCDYLGSIICNGIQDNYSQCFKLTANKLKLTIGSGKAWIDGHYFLFRYSVHIRPFKLCERITGKIFVSWYLLQYW